MGKLYPGLGRAQVAAPAGARKTRSFKTGRMTTAIAVQRTQKASTQAPRKRKPTPTPKPPGLVRGDLTRSPKPGRPWPPKEALPPAPDEPTPVPLLSSTDDPSSTPASLPTISTSSGSGGGAAYDYPDASSEEGPTAVDPIELSPDVAPVPAKDSSNTIIIVAGVALAAFLVFKK